MTKMSNKIVSRFGEKRSLFFLQNRELSSLLISLSAQVSNSRWIFQMQSFAS